MDDESINNSGLVAIEIKKDEACNKESEGAEINNPQNIELLELKEIIDKHLSTIEGLVRYSKTKDANVLTLSKQLQEYRDGFTKNIYRRIALELIAFREECKKSRKELQKQELQIDTAIKYLGFLCDDFYDLIENLGLSQKGEEFLYNGKSLSRELTPVNIEESRNEIEIQWNNKPINDITELFLYLQHAEDSIVAILKNNSSLDTLISNYIKKDSIYEEGLYQIVLYPTMRKIVALYQSLLKSHEQTKEVCVNENVVQIYASTLDQIVESLEDILFLLDVSIDRRENDCYDSKLNRILKTILTDDPNLNEKIANRYTDCYVMDEKTIYPAKVDVYKTR